VFGLVNQRERTPGTPKRPKHSRHKACRMNQAASIQGHAKFLSYFQVTKPESLIWQRQSRL